MLGSRPQLRVVNSHVSPKAKASSLGAWTLSTVVIDRRSSNSINSCRSKKQDEPSECNDLLTRNVTVMLAVDVLH